MYEYVYEELTKDEVKQYLKRIGYEKELAITKTCLDELIYLHQCHVPFECLDIYQSNHVPSLSKEALFEKIVVKKRGGFCFELNGLFMLLLRSIGFEASSVACRVVITPGVLMGISHRATLVTLDNKKYIADVGFGGPMAPFAIEDTIEKQTVHGETFWIEDVANDWKAVCRLDSKGCVCQTMLYAPIPLMPKDFEIFCTYLLSLPTCIFKTRRTVNLRTVDGYKNITDNILTIQSGTEKKEYRMLDEELNKILCSQFGIELE